MAILCAVMAASNGFLALALIVFCLKARARCEALTSWQLGVGVRLDNHEIRILALEEGPGPPPAALARGALGAVSPAPLGQGAPPRSGRRTAEERSASSPPASLAPPPSGGLPVRLVTVVTRDDDPVHVREAVVEGAGDAAQSESPEQIRARLEAAEEAAEEERERARAKGEALPLSTLVGDDDEATVIKDAGAVRAAVAKMTGAPLPGSSPTLVSAREPTYEEKRVAQLMAEAEACGAPLDAAGVRAAAERAKREAREAYASPPRPRPPILPPPSGDDTDGETERRYEALRAKVRAMGLEVDHCHAEADGCSEGDDDRVTPRGFTSGQWRSMAAPDICHCNCEGCRRATACLLQAQREVRRGKRGR